MAVLVLDSEAVSAMAHGPKRRQEEVRAVIASARRRGVQTVVSTAILAELLRGGRRDAAINAALSREAFDLRDVDRRLAGSAGHLLGAANMDSRHAIDAFVAATAATAGGGVIVTCDPDDLARLVEPLPNIHVEAI